MKTASITSLWKEVRKKRVIYFMLLPGAFFLIIFSLYPILWILRYMFYHYTSFGDMKFVGIDNFIKLFKDEMFFNALFNTLIYAVGKIAMTIPFAFALAYICNHKFKGCGLFRTVIFMPTIISVSVMSMIFYLIFNPYNGNVNQLLIAMGIIDKPINWFNNKYAMITVLIVAIWGAVGNYMIYFLSGLQTIPNEIYESAQLDGATGWKKLYYITIPMMAPISQMVIMLAIIQAFKDYENIMVLTSGGPNNSTEVLYLYIYRLMFPMGDSGAATALQYGYGATVAFATAIIVGVVTLIYIFWSKKMSEIF